MRLPLRLFFLNLHLDKNECLKNNGNCSHFCFNERGSYRCGCPLGYSLKSDEIQCEGKLTKYTSKFKIKNQYFTCSLQKNNPTTSSKFLL